MLHDLRQRFSTLITPLPTVTDPQRRRNASLLLSLVVGSVPLIVLLMVVYTIFERDASYRLTIVLSTSGMLVVNAITYPLVRRGRYEVGVYLLAAMAAAVIIVPAILLGGYYAFTGLNYLIAIPICCSLILRTRQTAAISIFYIVLLLMLAMVQAFPDLDFVDVMVGPLAFNAFIASFALIVAYFRQQAESLRRQELTQSEARYRRVAELISDYAFAVRLDEKGHMRYEWMTQNSFERTTGYSLQEYLEQSSGIIDFDNLIYPEDDARLDADIARTIQGDMTESQYRIVRKDGSLRWIQAIRKPIWEDGRVTGFYGSAQDITARKEVELALIASEERYRTMTELISDYAFACSVDEDQQVRLEWVTEDSFRRLSGYTVAEVVANGRLGNELYHPEDREAFAAQLTRVLDGQESGGVQRIITKSGTIRWISVSRRPVRDAVTGRVTHFYGVAQDVTERKEAELALTRSEERYRMISELISDFAYYVSVDGEGKTHLEWFTDSIMRLTGYDRSEIDHHMLQNNVYPEDIPLISGLRQKLLAGEAVRVESRIVKKNGEPCWLATVAHPTFDQGRITGYYVVSQDINARKEAEAQRLRLMVEQEQTAMTRHFVEAVAHDFRTALATIETNRYLVERLLERGQHERIPVKLNSIHDSVSHLTNQLDHLHMVSSLSEPVLQLIHVNRVLESVGSEQAPRARQKQIDLQLELDSDIPSTLLDEPKLTNALRHLVWNAIVHTPQGGLVTLRSRLEGNYAVLEVEDTGIGITADKLVHIFDRYYKTDDARNVDEGGIGLGLTIVKMIVEAHGGRVRAQSRVDAGSCFSLYLPLNASAASVPALN
jgi:PAS domain S-box-containing protein